ncbi:MAG: 3D domain-containing protein [Bryobacteraceae bacterium]
MTTRLLLLVFSVLLAWSADTKQAKSFTSMASAHSVAGETAAGTKSRVGTVSADLSVLPLGSRIRISEAGKYSGTYTVEDTGRKISGREIDIYMKTAAEAKAFGRKRVRVSILQLAEKK